MGSFRRSDQPTTMDRKVSQELSRRIVRIFLRDDDGARPVYGDIARFQTDPQWRDLIQFHEYFHGDTGRGVGASHQTGWTALVVRCLEDLAAERERAAVRPVRARRRETPAPAPEAGRGKMAS